MGDPIDFELGIKKQIPEVVKEIFTPEQIEEYKQLFFLYDYDNEGVININMVPKILTRAQHEYKPLDLQLAMQEIDDSKGPEIDEMIFLQLAAKCYRQSWSKKQILKAFNMLNHPRKQKIINSSLLQYYISEYGEPLDLLELKMFMFLANVEPETGNVKYKDLIKKLGLIVPRKHQKSRIKKEIKMKLPKITEAVQRISVKKKKAPETVKKSQSIDRLLKTIDMISMGSSEGPVILGEGDYDDDDENYFTISEVEEIPND